MMMRRIFHSPLLAPPNKRGQSNSHKCCRLWALLHWSYSGIRLGEICSLTFHHLLETWLHAELSKSTEWLCTFNRQKPSLFQFDFAFRSVSWKFPEKEERCFPHVHLVGRDLLCPLFSPLEVCRMQKWPQSDTEWYFMRGRQASYDTAKNWWKKADFFVLIPLGHTVFHMHNHLLLSLSTSEWVRSGSSVAGG